MSDPKAMKRHGRAFLNPPGSRHTLSSAGFMLELQDGGSPYGWLTGQLEFRDCEGRAVFELEADTEDEFRVTLHKLNAIIDVVTLAKDALEELHAHAVEYRENRAASAEEGSSDE